MITTIENLYKEGLSKNQILKSDKLPAFTKEANKRWLKMTIEAFYEVVDEKQKLLENSNL